MNSELIAVANNAIMGRVLRVPGGKLVFRYEESWRSTDANYPLSLAMPLAQLEHPHARIEPFLWGLLPDNEAVLGKWAQRFHVSARDAFGLLAGVGEDCAGAVQFVRPERLDELRSAGEPHIEWLTERAVADRLRRLREDHSAWRSPSDTGQFSLAGAQPKTALLFEGGRWGVPSGRTPTTHILKPPTGEWDGHAENEHMCLEIARRLGLIVARSKVQRFGNEIAIVLERYDRLKTDVGLLRVHQEDTCQATGVSPTRKYESEGGPGVRAIVSLLRDNSDNPEEDVASFLDAIAFNWLIVGTDAHAKNYSVLIGSAGVVRFAPLYDLASILPYEIVAIQKVRLAMKIGGNYRVRDIGLHQWEKLATENRVNAQRLISRLRDLSEALPDQVSSVRDDVLAEGLQHPLIHNLAKALHARARDAQRILAS
jgi:serine/threonine-protein kinase HipA